MSLLLVVIPMSRIAFSSSLPHPFLSTMQKNAKGRKKTNKIITNWNAWKFQDNHIENGVIMALIVSRSVVYCESFLMSRPVEWKHSKPFSIFAPGNWIKWNWHTLNDCQRASSLFFVLSPTYSGRIFFPALQFQSAFGREIKREFASQSFRDYFSNKLAVLWCLRRVCGWSERKKKLGKALHDSEVN